MSATNLAQCEQYLKSLEQSIKQIGDRHQQIEASLHAVQTIAKEASQVTRETWSEVITLFTWTDQLRSVCVSIEQDHKKTVYELNLKD